MSVLKRRPAHADTLARWAWIAVALTPAGWASGIVLAFLSGEGEARGIGPVSLGLLGVLLFVAAPVTAVVLAARAGHRSGKIAEIVSGSLLLATLFLTLLLGWIGLIVTAVITAAGSRLGTPPQQAVAAPGEGCTARAGIAAIVTRDPRR